MACGSFDESSSVIRVGAVIGDEVDLRGCGMWMWMRVR